MRISWTLLNLWMRGDVQGAVDYYLGYRGKETDAIIAGKAFDEMNNLTVETVHRLADEFGGIQLNNPIPQLKLELNYKEFTVVGVLDVYDDPTIYEVKTGRVSALQYANSGQLKLYAWLALENGFNVKDIIVVRYNQHVNEMDWFKVWVNKTMVEEAKRLIDTVGNEIYESFLRMGIYHLGERYWLGRNDDNN